MDECRNLNLITYCVMIQTKSRTIGNYWLLGLLPENHILVNKADADRLGLGDDDTVRIVSASNTEGVWNLKNGHQKPTEGKIKGIEGTRPGGVALSLGQP